MLILAPTPTPTVTLGPPGTTLRLVISGGSAPGWWVPLIGAAGVLVGILAKWLIDAITEKSRRDREDRLRFVADLRQAYASLIVITHEVLFVVEQKNKDEARVAEIKSRAQELRGSGAEADDEAKALLLEMRGLLRSGKRRTKDLFLILARYREAIASARLLAPAEVLDLLPLTPDVPRRGEEEVRESLARFEEAARRDLGVVKH